MRMRSQRCQVWYERDISSGTTSCTSRANQVRFYRISHTIAAPRKTLLRLGGEGGGSEEAQRVAVLAVEEAVAAARVEGAAALADTARSDIISALRA